MTMINIRHGDCRDVLRAMPAQSVHCCVTSPPYFGLRDFGVAGQIGLEPTPDAFVAEMVAVFRDVRRVLRDDGTLWLNLGDNYVMGVGLARGRPYKRHVPQKSGLWKGTRSEKRDLGNNGNLKDAGSLKPKDLIGIPWRVAFALQADGWYLRQDIIWSKPNPMPENVTDRCTKAHEYIFLMSKSARYFYDADAIREPHQDKNGIERFVNGCGVGERRSNQGWAGGKVTLDQHREYNPLGRNKRSVWEVTTQPFSEAHFATFPPALIEPCIKAGCPVGGTVLDPFAGAGTTGMVADRLQRNAILIELNADYAAMAERRIRDDAGMFAEVQP
jgi:DNA modification methylase